MSARQDILDIAKAIENRFSTAAMAAQQLRAVAESLTVPTDEVMAHHLAVLRDKGDAVYQVERDSIARYIEAQAIEIVRLRREVSDAMRAPLTHAMRLANSHVAVAESKLAALTERCEALEKVVDLARELRKAEYNYHAAISWDDITAILSLGNKTREARAKLDAALAEKSNG